MEFRLLGDMEVVSEGKALALGPHQQRAVLAVLVLSSGEVVTSDRLIGALWGERPPATAAKTVQVYVSRLRKTLNGAQQGTAAPEGLIVTADGGYVLRADCEQVDVCVLEAIATSEPHRDRSFHGIVISWTALVIIGSRTVVIADSTAS